ncbi:lysylphosphatidylglycerol synthase transmembrane domain-containing protein [Tunicatimonas pelagia]|uniref:lysylphosphatidylglycerol synthase transmembrane domain-containing protein n=1 Tax=Tunicatimonas pelagia TaxID=931531 RepID=UPI002665A2D1|nr:lysylphosphatidylglycerol synthase transmembrane domain-containing protein [Tunicatimonas pelagia]WKN45931.1 lysylphosphatidylglycerol synthase transmembrane domain-containing protein [Tunicatimonas pelagia]
MKGSLNIRSIAKYVVSLAIAGGLLYLVFRNVDTTAILNKLREVQYQWVILAVVIFIVSHIVRAYRWNLMLQPLGYQHLRTFRTLLAVLTAYFANLIIPRMGEVTRCGVLRQLDKVPVTTSLGTVVAERLVDLLSLFALMALLFLTEFGRLSDFITGFWEEKFSNLGEQVFAIYVFTGIATVGLLTAFFLVRAFWDRLQQNALFQKTQTLLREVLRGVTSIGKIKKQGQFWLATVSMWFMYFLVSYTVFFAIPETSNLGASAGLAVLVMGSLGMAAPVQGGIGTFHALVSGVLLLYGIEQGDGVLFATLIHGMQTLSFIVMGGFAFFMVSVLSSRKIKTATTS